MSLAIACQFYFPSSSPALKGEVSWEGFLELISLHLIPMLSLSALWMLSSSAYYFTINISKLIHPKPNSPFLLILPSDWLLIQSPLSKWGLYLNRPSMHKPRTRLAESSPVLTSHFRCIHKPCQGSLWNILHPDISSCPCCYLPVLATDFLPDLVVPTLPPIYFPHSHQNDPFQIDQATSEPRIQQELFISFSKKSHSPEHFLQGSHDSPCHQPPTGLEASFYPHVSVGVTLP